MLFSSLVFLFIFLPLTLFVYYTGPKKWRNGILLAASLIFYAWGEPVYIFLMLFSAATDYVYGLFIHKFRSRRPAAAKLALLSSILINISILGFFKYADFLIANINTLFGTSIMALNLPLPIGLSFYTFQTMSYTIDVYRGKCLPQKNPIALATYVCLFPQLVAGPIVRYERIATELIHRKWCSKQFAEGISLFIKGLGKKVLLANNIGLLWNGTQQQDFNELSLLSAWLGIIAFAFQIYFDFSGYSDMAVGLGKMFGFNFPKNFHYPYIAKSASEFWRRWHITLSSWFRDYVYIPLGGSKQGKLKLYRNLFIIWGLTGLWHGASWNYVLWGLYFGTLIAAEKAGMQKLLEKLPPFMQHIYLLFIILISWVLFVFEDFTKLHTYLKIMFGFHQAPLFNGQFLYDLYTNLTLLAICTICSIPILDNLNQKYNSGKLQATVYFIILILSTAYLVDATYNPFLYFRF